MELISVFQDLSRRFLINFFQNFISTGCLCLLEGGGSQLIFKGPHTSPKVDLIIHNPQFYWKVTTRRNVGLFESYVDGDFSFVDIDHGLLNFFLLLIANMDRDTAESGWWWKGMLFASAIPSIGLFYRRVWRQNTLTQARANTSAHYDISAQVFALFLDERMIYSCGIFKTEDEDLNTAQSRKISLLIDKARIGQKHEVLDIGCGWGIFAIELVKRTGCKYTGVSLSKEQLNFAEHKVKEAGLQDNIKFMLCDYRQVPKTKKYDRILAIEMIEHVGHEFMKDFFSSIESLLAQNGLLVLQFIASRDQSYDEDRRYVSFMHEYIFPGGCLPSLSWVISSMKSASKLSVEHVENIGSHYYPTLRHWRNNLIHNKSKIMEMGYDEKFIRWWEYYFDYCAAGFKAYTIGNYQVVFSRPRNTQTLGFPYKGFPSAYQELQATQTSPIY